MRGVKVALKVAQWPHPKYDNSKYVVSNLKIYIFYSHDYADWLKTQLKASWHSFIISRLENVSIQAFQSNIVYAIFQTLGENQPFARVYNQPNFLHTTNVDLATLHPTGAAFKVIEMLCIFSGSGIKKTVPTQGFNTKTHTKAESWAFWMI